MSSPVDTPARAAAIPRPHTRHWRRLLTEANNLTSTSTAVRRSLRDHLDAADRAAAKRAALVATRKKTTTTQSPEYTGPQPPSASAHWEERVSAFNALASAPTDQAAALFASELPAALRDLRSAVVAAAGAAVEASASHLVASGADLASLVDAALSGVAVTKRVIADANRTALLALLVHVRSPELWSCVASGMSSGASTTRVVVLQSVKQLVECVQDSQFQLVADVSRDVLSTGALDRTQEVRDTARAVLVAVRKRFGDDKTDELVQSLPTEARGRLSTKPAVAQGGKIGKRPGVGDRPNIREMIAAKRRALEAARKAEKTTTASDKPTVTEDDADENTAPVSA